MKLSDSLLNLFYIAILIFILYVLQKQYHLIENFDSSVGSTAYDLLHGGNLSSLVGKTRYISYLLNDEDESEQTTTAPIERTPIQLYITNSTVTYQNQPTTTSEPVGVPTLPYDRVCEIRFNPNCTQKSDGQFSEDCYVRCPSTTN